MRPEKVAEAFDRRRRKMGEAHLNRLADYQLNSPPGLRPPIGWLGPTTSIVTPSSRVCVMGSCMARELKLDMRAKGFQVLERGRNPKVLAHGSAEWERTYTTKVMLQEVQRILGVITLPTYQLESSVIDPHRKDVTFASQEEADESIAAYVADGRVVLAEADVLLLTIGLSEGWRDPATGFAYAEIPPMPLWRQLEFEPEMLTMQDNADNLLELIDLVRSVNPGLPVIIGVEPQGLRATFVDRSVFVSDAAGKAGQVLAAHLAVASRPDVHYFPSWEAVTYGPHERFGWDGRHLTPEALGEVVATFAHCFAGGADPTG